VDWYLTRENLISDGIGELRRAIRDYLVRHGEARADVSSAELIVQELLTNAGEHAAGPTWVHLSWSHEHPDIEIWDLGPGFALLPAAAGDEPPDLEAEGGRGLFIVSHLAADFRIQARRGGGTRVTARLPVRRATSRSFDPPPMVTAALPDLDEAGVDGSFGSESFLRALVVQLSQAVESTAGPDVGEEVVTQVGLAVGGQMEAAYRAVRRLTDALSGEQIADCLVQLKHAIHGRFRVAEITDDRIVLDNTNCPFGEAVRKAPALCRMTSSVFGGIAARNSPDGAAVVLEERIAVGDAGCRVVVYLGTPPDHAARFAHRYPAAAPSRLHSDQRAATR
jgi:anti-sigma regulatory factor (Ser/Thr protein kinase)